MSRRHPVVWLAGPDGEAHIHPRRGRTLCGAPGVPKPSMAWPELSRCIACSAGLDRRSHMGAGARPIEDVPVCFGCREVRPVADLLRLTDRETGSVRFACRPTLGNGHCFTVATDHAPAERWSIELAAGGSA